MSDWIARRRVDLTAAAMCVAFLGVACSKSEQAGADRDSGVAAVLESSNSTLSVAHLSDSALVGAGRLVGSGGVGG